MKTDSLDRFGTRLENRFTKKEIHNMMEMFSYKILNLVMLSSFGLLVKKIKNKFKIHNKIAIRLNLFLLNFINVLKCFNDKLFKNI